MFARKNSSPKIRPQAKSKTIVAIRLLFVMPLRKINKR